MAEKTALPLSSPSPASASQTTALAEAVLPQPYHVIVLFGKGIPAGFQGPALLAMEKYLREQGVPAEVFKPTHADDLKSRREMTAEQRANL